MRLAHQLPVFVAVAALSAFSGTASAQPSRKSAIPSFTTAVANETTAQAFGSFVDKSRGKLVHFNVEIAPRFSWIGGKIKGKDDPWLDFFVATSPCEEPQAVLMCAGAHYLLSGNDFVLEFYKGNNRFNGYFVVGENVENHQGLYYMLKSVPAAQVILQTQGK
jgi:hypothetical protein